MTYYLAPKYIIAGLIIGYAIYRFARNWKKYGSLRKFKKIMRHEHKKPHSQHKKEIKQNPELTKQVIDVIRKKKSIKRIKLYQHVMHISRPKVNVILTQLEEDKIISIDAKKRIQLL